MCSVHFSPFSSPSPSFILWELFYVVDKRSSNVVINEIKMRDELFAYAQSPPLACHWCETLKFVELDDLK